MTPGRAIPIPLARPSTTRSTRWTRAAGCASDDDAIFVEGPIEPMAADLVPLGDLPFSTAPSSLPTATYQPGSASFELELAAPDGYIWTLQVPALALGRPTDISMTALENLAADEIPGQFVSGVLLEPDGLRFDVPATLTVTGGLPEAVMVVLGGGHDGTAMDLAMAVDGSLASAQVTHFSSYAADNVDQAQLDQLTARADAQYQELQRRASEVVADRPLRIPVPPALPLRCASGDEATANEAAMSAFRDAFADAEIVLAQKMLAVGTDLQLLGTEADVFSTEQQLLARSLSKARMLFLEYGNDARYLPAVGAVLLNALKNAQLLGTDDPEIAADFAELATMYRSQIRSLLDELIEQHEYRNVRAVATRPTCSSPRSPFAGRPATAGPTISWVRARAD